MSAKSKRAATEEAYDAGDGCMERLPKVYDDGCGVLDQARKKLSLWDTMKISLSFIH